MMLKEAGDFAGHLRRMEKDIRGLKNATEGAPLPRLAHAALWGWPSGWDVAWVLATTLTALHRKVEGPCARSAWSGRPGAEGKPGNRRLTAAHFKSAAGLLTTTKAILSAPLPRVYEETGGGKVVPVNASQGQGQVVMPIGGADFNAEELAKIAKDTGKKLESEVLAPMERWMNAYNLVQVRGGLGQQEAADCRWVRRRRQGLTPLPQHGAQPASHGCRHAHLMAVTAACRTE